MRNLFVFRLSINVRLILSLILFTFTLVLTSLVQASSLEITSLNIKWFGRGGELHGSVEDEYRSEHIKQYIDTYFQDSDIFVFQEIVDKEGLFKIMHGFECVSYDADSDRHQFVVMCSKPGLLQSFEINQKVRLNRWGLRAAVVGDYKVQGELIKVIGVHLKAGNKDTQVRLDQVEALKESYEDLSRISSGVDEKVILIGDFNTYKTPRTNLDRDDSELISLSLGNDFVLAENTTATYMGFGGRVFDRAWFKGFSSSKARVLGPCKFDSVQAPYSDKSYYREFISDHCALKVDFKF